MQEKVLSFQKTATQVCLECSPCNMSLMISARLLDALQPVSSLSYLSWAHATASRSNRKNPIPTSALLPRTGSGKSLIQLWQCLQANLNLKIHHQ